MRALPILAFVACLCLSLVLPQIPVQADATKNIAIIVHKDNPVTKSDETKGSLADIFLKNTTKWKDKSEIQVCQQSATSDAAKVMLEDVLEKSEKELAKHWADQRKKGIDEPVTKSSDKLTFRYVSSRKAAIGYVLTSYMESLEDADKKKVKVLLTTSR